MSCKVGRISAFCFLALCAVPALAADGVSVGIHGPGALWSAGTPTVRWRVDGSSAFDLTLALSYLNDGGNLAQYDWSYNWRMEVAWLHAIGQRQNFVLSSRPALAYGKNEQRVSGATFESWSVETSMGLDLEYFVPVLTDLSIGAQACVRLRFGEIRWRGDFRERFEVDVSGQVLSVRYYF